MDLQGVGELIGGVGSPRSRQALMFIPSSCNRESEKTPIPYPGTGLNFKTYWTMLI